MLTRSERRFVKNPEEFIKSQRRLHRCRINKKIRLLASDLKDILEKNEYLGLDLHELDGIFGSGKAFQNSETASQETILDSGISRNSILDRLENW
jgi:hypothetical protein